VAVEIWEHLELYYKSEAFFSSSCFFFYKPVLMASGDQNASSPVDLVRMEVRATQKLEPVTVLLVTQDIPVPHVSNKPRQDDQPSQ
jgi:hypothetical protein